VKHNITQQIWCTEIIILHRVNNVILIQKLTCVTVKHNTVQTLKHRNTKIGEMVNISFIDIQNTGVPRIAPYFN